MADTNPYRYLTPDQQAMAPAQRWPLYNGGAYKADANPFGLGEGGQDILFEAWKADFLAIIGQGQALASMFATFQQAGTGGWAVESRAVSRLAANQIAIAWTGTDTGLASLIYKTNRRLTLLQTVSGVGAVLSAVDDAVNAQTIVTVQDIVVDTGLTAVWLGQDPDNAPKAESAPGSDLYLAATYNCLMY
jgi:hypothetical protein